MLPRPEKDQDKKPGDDKKKSNEPNKHKERSDKDGKKDDEGATPDKDKDLALSAGDLSVAVLLRALKELWAVIDCIRETGYAVLLPFKVSFACVAERLCLFTNAILCLLFHASLFCMQ